MTSEIVCVRLRSWLIVLALARGAVAQGDALPRTRNDLGVAEASAVLAEAEQALAGSPMDLDAHRLRIMALVRLGRRGEAEQARTRLAQLFAQRLAELDRMLREPAPQPVAEPTPPPANAQRRAAADAEAPGRTDSPPSPPPPPARVETDPHAELERLITDSQSTDPAVRDAAAARANRALNDAWSAFRSKPGDPAQSRRRLAAIGRGSELQPAAGIPILAQMEDTGEPELQAQARSSVDVVIEQQAAAAGDAMAGGDPDTARRRLEPARAAAELRQRMRGPDGRRAVAQAMRALSGRLERWAAQLEREADAADAQWQARVDAFRTASDELARDPLTLGAAEDGLRALAGSRIESVAASARARLRELARERIAKARALPADQASEAAAQLERAYACDPSQAEAGFDAASFFEGFGDIAAAMAIHKRLVGAAQFAERSQKWARERLQAVRKDLAATPMQVPTGTDERQWPALLDLLRRRVPVLAGPELDAIADLVQQRQFAAAEDRVRTRLAQIRDDAFELPTVAQRSGPPALGESFTLAALGVPGRFVAGEAGQPGFWVLEVPVRSAHWRAVMRDRLTAFRDEPEGHLEASWNNCTQLCTDLTASERAAGSLPADYSYALPTVAQLERLRDASGRLPGLNANYCWTAEEGKEPYELGKKRRVVPVAAPGPVGERRACAPVYGVGALLVLAPNR